MNEVQLIASVASAAVKAALTAVTGRPHSTPTSQSTPKPVAPPRRKLVTVDRHRLSVAVHEAGHAVAGVVLGAELRSAVLAPEGTTLRGGRAGQTNFSDQATYHDPQVAYAGPLAEAMFAAGGRRPSQRAFYDLLDSNGCHDRRVLVASGGIHEGADVEPIIQACWAAVMTTARQLYTVGEATREDVLNALGVTDGGGLTSVQLASLRSGCRPVPAFTKTPAPA